jgi:hypothetical protein
MKKGADEVRFLIILVVALCSVFGCAPSNPAEQFGVQIANIRLTGADHFIDFRYRILDPEKASPFLDRGEQMLLVDQSTGTKHPVTRNKLGPLRASGTKPEVNRQYTVLFSNVNKEIKVGSKVSLLVGDKRIDGLVVE